ncbi:MAG: HAD family hydrolase [Candidatus Spyradosoma sp.]
MKTGVIFAWDGVVLDSADYHERSWKALADEHGFVLPAGYLRKTFGRDNVSVITSVLNWTSDPGRAEALAERKEALMRQIFTEETPEPLPGVRGLLNALREREIPCAVACPVFREEVDFVLEILGLTGAFSAVIAHGNVQTNVGAAEAFQLAAKAVDRAPRDCIAVLSTISGIEAARAAGMKTVAVATVNPRNLLERAGADAVLASMRELDASTISALSILPRS